MFVGHEFLAFALAGWGARRFGVPARDALVLGAVAGFAALLPDLDVLYAVATYAAAVAGGTPLGWEAFWGVANGVHRVVTHPLPVGVAAALLFGVGAAIGRWSRGRDGPVGGTLGVVAGLVTLFYTALLLRSFLTTAGVTNALVAVAFLVVVGFVGAVVGRRTRQSVTSLTVAGAVGFLTHPFGDVLLAAPPPLLSPFGPPLLTERVSLASDPTMELFGVLFVELAAVWLGVLVAMHLGASATLPIDAFAGRTDRDRLLRALTDRRAGVGVAYAAAVFVLPLPTIVDAHVLGFTIVPFALLVGTWAALRVAEGNAATGSTRSRRLPVAALLASAITGLLTLTVAAVAYLSTYALVSGTPIPAFLG